MMLDVLRGYVQVAGGLSDVAVRRARGVAEALLSQGAQASARGQEHVTTLAEDLVKHGQTNSEILVGMIRSEVDRAVGRMGFVREDELAAVRSHVQRLEKQLQEQQAGAGTGAGPAAEVGPADGEPA